MFWMKDITEYFEERQRDCGLKSPIANERAVFCFQSIFGQTVNTTSTIASGSFYTEISDAVKDSHFRSLITDLTAMGGIYDVPYSTKTNLLLLSLNPAL